MFALSLSRLFVGLAVTGAALLAATAAQAATVAVFLENRTSESISVRFIGPSGRTTSDVLRPRQRKTYTVEAPTSRGVFLDQSGGSATARWTARNFLANGRWYVISPPGRVTDIGSRPTF
jgi:hypothetical protein